MEVACGEHGEAIHKLVNSVNTGKSSNYNQVNAQNSRVSLVQTNNKILNSSLTTTSYDEPSSGVVTHDSVIVDIDLIKKSTTYKQPNEYAVISVNPNRNLQDNPIGPASSLLDSSTESVTSIKKEHHKNHINGFPTSSWTQFWILLKRTFLTIVRDQTLTQMRLVSHVVVGAIIGMIYYGIGNDASKIMSNAGCLFFTTLFTMFTGTS